MKAPNTIFIGGTGRCGTNILKDSLRQHPDIYGLDFESRFTIDPNGVIPTYISLKKSWSPLIFNKNLSEFKYFVTKLSKKSSVDKITIIAEKLIRAISPNISLKAYSQWELEEHFPNILTRTDDLINKLSRGTYKSYWYGNSFISKSMYTPLTSSVIEDELTDVFSKYMNQLISDLLVDKNKSIYVDDNTFNTMFAHEIVTLLPRSLVVHIYRDPRDVVASYLNQRWCPSDIDQAIDYYCSLMNRWLEIRKKIPKDQLFEVKFEDFTMSPYRYLNRILGHFSLESCYEGLDININRNLANTGRWKKEIRGYKQQEKVCSRLGFWIDYFGYK